MSVVDVRERWDAYLSARRGTYEFRCQRYAAVTERLVALGLETHDPVVDVGAGRCEFGLFLRSTGWKGLYLPVDGSLDGVDLEEWMLPRGLEPSFFVAIELLEHLENPWRLMEHMRFRSTKGVVLTTPNPDAVDVFAIDPTHRTAISADELDGAGWHVVRRSFFCRPDDSLLAWT